MLKMPRTVNNNGTSTGSSFPAANNFLQKKWNDRAYKLHREKVKSTKTKLDTTKPKECPHLHLNLKKIQMEEEKQALIDRDNRILLSKLTNVLRSDGSLDNWNYEFDTRPRTLHAPHMQREQERIAKENERIMKRLNNASGTYNFQKLEDDYLMHEYYKSMKSQETKTYELQARGFEDDEVPHLKKSPREEGEHVEEGATAAAPAEGDDKLPAMETRPPPPRRLLKRHSTKLPLLGAERRKEEEKKKKEAISKPSRYDEKEDAAKLFKAIKGMLKAEPILIQVLARRTYAQRQQTISKFNQQYELDLEEDFTSQLDGDYHDFVSALLARREEVDAMALNHALKGSGSLAETFIEILCTRNNTALGVIKATYHRLYGIELEEDIKSEVKGQLRHLFLALIKGSRNEKMAAKSDIVETDASELMDDDPDRWTVNGGKLGELLSAASFDHIRAVLQEYDKVTDWELVQELKRTLSGDYKDAMLAMVKCLNNCASFLADQIHQVLTGEADESALIRIMITRSEVDLLQIRRAYRKKYNEPLIDALETKCRSPIKKALIQMVLVHGAPREEYETEKNDSDKQTVLPRVTPAPEAKGKPLRGPQPNKDATLPADNPLVRSTKWHPKSPVRRVVTPRGMNKAVSSQLVNPLVHSTRWHPKSPVRRVVTPRGMNKAVSSELVNPLVRSTKWHPKSPVRRVVTPRGMNKAVSSQLVNPLVHSTRWHPKSPVRRVVTPRGMNKAVSSELVNPLVRSTKWHPKSPVRRVVTPRGMNKAVSSQLVNPLVQ
ncbi:uncharacterized protein [Amphiura filiformis]|uniref:uncharacterized protein n=1 Tax=Amphiura filiformis TaxID=82378 RepID=UPI003B20D303